MRKWTWRSSPLSTEAETVSILACLETLLSVVTVLLIGFMCDYWMHVAIAVTLAPMLLLRTDESVRLGIKCIKSFDKDRYSYESRGARYISGIGLAVWALLMLVLIRIYATFKTVLRLRWKAISHIPNNWRFYALCLDSWSPPEAMAGLEGYVRNNPADKQLSQMTVKSLASRLIERNKNKPWRIVIFRTLIYSWVFTCLFASSFLLRLSLKASSIVYAPFIYFSRGISFSSSDLKVRASAILKNKDSLRWAIWVVWIGFTILPIVLASTCSTLRELYSGNKVLSLISNHFTFLPHMERWNVARLLCATITIVMFQISKHSLEAIEINNEFINTRVGRFCDGLLRSMNMLRCIGVMYVYLCGMILFWSLAAQLDLLASIRIVLPDIGSDWFPSLPRE